MGEDGDNSNNSSSAVPAAPKALKATSAIKGLSAPKAGVEFANGVDKQEVSAAQGDSISQDGMGEEGGEGAASTPRNPFDQYYAQLTHQQNMLQDSVRVSAYQRAIIENAANFKVGVLQLV